MDNVYQKKCICKMCPTYVSCGESLAFCIPENGSSRCIKIMSGCVCPGCPVYAEKGFSKDYYCIPGNREDV
jgi:hypothetical protein